MKTKNILFYAFALVLLAAPLLAQEIGNYDYHEFEHKQKIGTSLKQIHKDTVNKNKYIDVGTLSNYLKEDLPIDLDKLQTKAANSIKNNKITPQEQYDLMLYCIEHNENKVLETLLKAGFDPDIDRVLNKTLKEGQKHFISLSTKAMKVKNETAFNLLWNYSKQLLKNKVEQNMKDKKTKFEAEQKKMIS